MIGLAANHFNWAEEAIMNMSYEKLIMYLNTTPIYESGGNEEGEAGKKPGAPVATGSFDLFDFDNR